MVNGRAADRVRAMAAPPVDPAVLDELRDALGEAGDDVYRGLIELFFDDTPGSLRLLEDALAAGETEGFARAAHRLRGSASSFGAEPLIELCTRAEKLARGNDLAAAAAVVPLIREELHRVEDVLRSPR
jgi:HPt (histidine-containing phosphotransfer) domain-containing protein